LGFNGDLYPSAGASVVMTTKGDMVDYDTERQRLGIGSTGQVLTVASSLPTWATLTTADSVLTTQGDVLYESASGLARLGFGTSGDVLTTKGTGANPVWETPSAGVTLSAQTATLGSTFSTSAEATWTTVTGLSFTALDNTGRSLVITALPCYHQTAGLWVGGRILDDSTSSAGMGYSQPVSNYGVMMSTGMSIANDGQTVAVQIYKDDTNALNVLGASVTAGQGMFTVTQIS